MAKRVIWTPKVHAPQRNRDPLRWCLFGQHIWKNHLIQPKTKLCVYCQKEEFIRTNDLYSLQID
jgi:hypothetical protein